MHFDRDRMIYIDINAFKKREFKAIIYYLKKDVNSKKLTRRNVKSILFLNCLLNDAESRY